MSCLLTFSVSCSDWIALNVLRNVALSTNSVAASVEPVIQQQFFTLSPMNGQEYTGAAQTTMLSETPTTSSMLAALHESFSAGPLDPHSADSYMSMGFVDPTNPSHDEGMPNVNGMFGDFGGPSFDVPSFTPHDLGLNNDASSVHSASSGHSSPEQKNDSVKDEKSS